MLPPRIAGVVEAIRSRADAEPDSVWCRFLADGRTESETISRRQLDDRSRGTALMLAEFVRPGDRVLIMCEPGIDYITAFLGCLYAGAIAVPAYPPSPLVLERSLERLGAVVRDADPHYALTSRLLMPVLAGAPALRRADGRQLRQLCVDDATMSPDAWNDGGTGAGSSVAFLQYTSGSTGDPKGVTVTHRSLLANLSMFSETFHTGPATGVVSWLPPYHDMGLVGQILWALVEGGPLTLMPPEAFLKHPECWMAAMSRYRAGLTASPDFGYRLAARRTRDEAVADLDLSHVEVAINGAEPVRADTLRAFADRFATAGLRPDAQWPSYGMAEATLLVSAGRWEAGATSLDADADALAVGRLTPAAGQVRTITSSGAVASGGTVRVVEPGGDRTLAPGEVGEILIGGEHVTAGYWNRVEAGDRVGAELRTGDLGCLLDDELYVTGRLKDIIVVRGSNHYPQDVEHTAESASSGVRAGCVVAFGIEQQLGFSDEQVVVVAELREGHPAAPVAAAVSALVSAVHGVRPAEVVLLAERTIPKTSSGKVQRAATKRGYLAGTLDAIPLDDQPARLEQPA